MDGPDGAAAAPEPEAPPASLQALFAAGAEKIATHRCAACGAEAGRST